MNKRILISLLSGAVALCAASDLEATQVTDLKCEHLVNPLGIDQASPRFTWRLEDGRTGAGQTAWRIVVGQDRGAVAAGKGEVWDSGLVPSEAILASYSGAPLESFTKYWWRVECVDDQGITTASDPAFFETAMLSQTDWKGSWISDGQDTGGNGISEPRAPYFRTEVKICKPLRSARAYICVAGLYELTINGERVGDHRLDPMFTRFDRRNLYLTHDITGMLKTGDNAIGVILGNGWYNHQPTAVWFFDRAPWRNRPAFCMDIRLEYEDGTTQIVSTNKSWKTALGPVTMNNIYTGEHYDARAEMPGWDKPGFDDSGWRTSINRAAPSQKLASQQLHPIRDVEELPARSVVKIDDRTWLFDFGKNISGVTEFTVSGPEGATFRLLHGEYLENGRLNIESLAEHYRPFDESDPFSTDVFTIAGKGEETFRARFNYKGFQYVEVTCDRPIELKADNIKAYFMHTDFPKVGKVETSSELINKLWEASCASYLSNFLGYPTDCPHREKNGWTGDANIACTLGLFNYDGITLYEKWIADHQDEQQPNGVLPCIIPSSGWGYHWANGVDWTSTIATIPWEVYLFYGDSHLLESAYDNIKRHFDFFDEVCPGGLVNWGLGDWVPVNSTTPVELTSSAYYYNEARILAAAARLLGKAADADKYTALAEKIRDAVNGKYLNRETGVYWEGTQTAQCVPLFWGLVPDEMKTKVADALVARIHADSDHIDVGLLGSKALLSALSDNGYADLAYTLATREDYPSWGAWIKHGATTFYETWEAEFDEAHRPASLNHIMFGEINAWFYKALGGINPDPENPGFKNIDLRPCFVKGLEYANVEHDSPYGKIVSCWHRKGRRVIYDVTIPPGAHATLTLPSGMRLRKSDFEGDTIPSGTHQMVIE